MWEFFSPDNWLTWGIILLTAFPLLVVILSELAYDLSKLGLSRYQKPVDLFRNSTLFLLFLVILLRLVIGLPSNHIAVRVIDTARWITVINLALATFNVLFFSGSPDSWRAQAPKLLVDLSRLFLVLVGAAFVVSTIWDVDLTSLLAALGVGSLVIGLALQDTLSNLFSGIAIVSARQFKIGDWISIGGLDGQVRSINWRSVSVATGGANLVVIPNSQIARERFVNYGADKPRFTCNIVVKVPNVEAPQAVLDLLQETAATTNGVMPEHAPYIIITGHEDSNIVYSVTVWASDFSSVHLVRSEFLANFWYGASRSDIVLPGSLAVPTATSAQNAPAPGVLAAKLEALGTFQRPREVLDTLVPDARYQVFRRGQRLLHAGLPSPYVYVLAAGRAGAYHNADGRRILVEEFSSGQMLLYKGILRSGNVPFDVTAETDIESIAIPAARVQTLLDRDPQLNIEIGRILTLRETTAERTAVHSQAPLAESSAESSHIDVLREMFRV